MENTFRITALCDSDNPELAQALTELVETRPYPFSLTLVYDLFDLDLGSSDVVVDLTEDNGLLSFYESLITSKVLVVSANSSLIAENKIYLSDLAKSLEAKLYLNSLFSGSEKHKLLNINEKNIKNYSDQEIRSSRVSDFSKLANSIYQDLTRAHNKWDPSFEQARRNREIQRKLETKQNLYEVAKSLNVELEAQPCGIDPKLPDIGEKNG
jgi:Homoserine dehydrogenase, NAD binding domain